MLLLIRHSNLRVEHDSARLPAAHRPDSLRKDRSEASQARQDVGNAVWRTRVHKECLLSSFGFWSSAFRCFLWMKLLRPRFCRLGRLGNVWFTRSSRARDSVCCRPMRHLVQSRNDLAINIDTSWHRPQPSPIRLLKRLLPEERGMVSNIWFL